jgi:hypothetical protein
MKRCNNGASLAAAMLTASLSLAVSRPAEAGPAPDAALQEAGIEAALEAFEKAGLEIRECMAAAGIILPWDEGGEAIDEAEAALWDRIDALCDAGRRDEAEAVFQDELLARHGITPAQFEEARQCAAEAAFRMRAHHVTIFGADHLPPLEGAGLHVCDD